MQVTHEPWLVALSLIVAIQGAFVGLSLAVQVGGSTGLRRRLLLAGAAFSLAVAIWSMHFVGMLATRLPFPVDYLVFPTLLSFLVCVLVVGAAVFAVSAGPPTGVRLATAATAMGAGIASMHYVGMSALHASACTTRFSSSLRASSSRSPRPALRFRLRADVAAAPRCCSRRSRSVPRSPACTTPRWPA
jgi:NO-binding membrane sensor protein with MHYT domain